MTHLLLVRHGETAWNAEHRIQGWSNSQLSERGRAQAARLAARLQNVAIDSIYSSDAARALDTAAPIAADHHLEILPRPGLRELGYGDWEGLTGEEIRQKFPDAWHRWHVEQQWTDTIPGGESWADVEIRMARSLADILAAHPGSESTVAVVGHGGSLRVLILRALDLPLSSLRRFHLGNASLSRLQFSPDAPGRAMALNDTGHLEEWG